MRSGGRRAPPRPRLLTSTRSAFAPITQSRSAKLVVPGMWSRNSLISPRNGAGLLGPTTSPRSVGSDRQFLPTRDYVLHSCRGHARGRPSIRACVRPFLMPAPILSWGACFAVAQGHQDVRARQTARASGASSGKPHEASGLSPLPLCHLKAKPTPDLPRPRRRSHNDVLVSGGRRRNGGGGGRRRKGTIKSSLRRSPAMLRLGKATLAATSRWQLTRLLHHVGRGD